MAKRPGSAPDPRGPWPGDPQRQRPPGSAGQTWRTRPRRGRRLWRWRHGPPGSGPLRRGHEDRLVGGVAAGLAARTGWDVTVVRTVFVLACLVSGFGTVPYVLAWLLVPAVDEDASIASRALTDRRGITLAAGLGSLVVVVLLIGSALDASWLSSLASPLIISGAGMVLIWRNASAGEQAMLRRLSDPVLHLAEGGRRSRTVVRTAIACLLLVVGVIILEIGGVHRAALRPLAGATLVLAAIVVVLGPWWFRIGRDLVVERQARARAEERADMAARVHDSVLQTLALIQRRAGEPQQVIALARAQERELRSWLFDGRAPGSLDGQVMTVAAGIRLIQQEVEERHGIPVEAVIVGDCELDDDLNALLAAAREATVNAVKWSGAPVVSVFAEIELAQVSVFVRDRGQGFDPETVPADRKGLAESVHARMARRGGSAAVRTAPGEGTEVSLTMPRAAGKVQPGPPSQPSPPHQPEQPTQPSRT